MKLFDVYPLYEVTPVKARGVYVYDQKRQKYLDLYGGHAVMSIGHSHPHFVRKISRQLKNWILFKCYPKSITISVGFYHWRTLTPA